MANTLKLNIILEKISKAKNVCKIMADMTAKTMVTTIITILLAIGLNNALQYALLRAPNHAGEINNASTSTLSKQMYITSSGVVNVLPMHKNTLATARTRPTKSDTRQ